MNVLFSPQVSDEKINYTFSRDIITVEYKGEVDTFDFSYFPDGKMERYDAYGADMIQTVLEINPIISAEKKEGVLYVELINMIGADAKHEERFPEWINQVETKGGVYSG